MDIKPIAKLLVLKTQAENMRLKPYPEYRDSGVPWLGEVPSHWGVVRLGSVLKERGESNESASVTQVLSVLRDVGVIRYEDKGNIGNKKSDDITSYKIVRHGDIVVNSMNVIIGSVGMSRFSGCLSPVYYVLRTRLPDYDPQFYEYVFRVKTFQRSLIRLGNGILAHRMRIPMELLKREPLPKPPLNEQRAIVSYLDSINQQIRRLIRTKQRMIKLLNEQKQAIIHQTVTRGLDPDMKMKPTGLDWLPEVPEHWEVAPLRRYSSSRCDGPFGSGLKSSHYTDSGIRVIRLQNIGYAEFLDGEPSYISAEHYATLGDHDVLPGDLLIAGLGEDRIPAGRACVAPDHIQPAMVKADCFRFRLKLDCLLPEFVALQLSATAAAASAILSTGATRQRVNLQATSGRGIAIPSGDEQAKICQFVAEERWTIGAAVRRIEREIELIREYRTRLISDVVTGKLDVRCVELPEVGEDEAEPYPLDSDPDELREVSMAEEVSHATD